MTISTARLALLSSVPAALAVGLLPQAAQAQSTTCSQAGTTVTCIDGANTVLTATTTAGNTTVAGPGLVMVDTTTPATTTYTGSGPIATTGVTAVNLTSTGGALTFGPAAGVAPVKVRTVGGVGANAVQLNTAGQAATVTVGNITTTGANSFGVLSTAGTDLTLQTGSIAVTGANSTAIDAGAQTGNISIVAGDITANGRGLRTNSVTNGSNTIVVGNVTTGDRGILANGGTVSVTTGTITTSTNGGTTPGGYGVAAQAFTGNVTVRTGAVSTANGAGIIGTAFGATGSVDIGGCPSVATTGNNSTAVVGQANGNGNVTISCGALATTGDNSNGVFSFSNGGNMAVTIGSATTSGVGSYGLTANTSGAGTVITNSGAITTTGAGSTGIYSRADTGAIKVFYGNITTSGVGNGAGTASALDLASTGVIGVRGTGATLRTNGAGVTAALINGAGVNGTLGNVTTTGAGAQGAIINSTGAVDLIVGTVATTGNGLTVNAGANAVSLTTGTVAATEAGATGTVINSTGAVTFTGGRQTANNANALRINGGGGAINATVNGAATTNGGIAVAITGTGPVTFANTGSITTTGATSGGLRITGVTTATVACGDVSTTGAGSEAVVIKANGTTAVTCGTVSTSGANSPAFNISNTAGTTTFTGGTTTTTGAGSAGITVQSSAAAATGLVTVNTGTVTTTGAGVTALSTGGANVVVNANGNVTSPTATAITATTAGTAAVTIAAGTATTGLQGVNLQGAAGNSLTVNGVLRNTTGTTPYTVLAGGPFTLTLGASGTIVGPLTFTTGNDTFNNQGTTALQPVLDFLAGADVLNNTGTLTAFTGTSAINNLETFNNAGGLIDLRDGAANDVVVLTNSNYVASGNARLGIDVGGTGTITADRLVIGGTTSGTTTVLANILNPVIDTTGAVVVDSTLNNLTAGQFVLGSQASFGLVNYALQVRGGDVFIVSTPDARIYDTVFVGRQVRDLWYQSADAYTGYASARRVSFGVERKHPIGIWAQLYGDRQTVGDRSRTATAFGTTFTAGDRIRTDYRGAQAGLDFGKPNFVIGVTGGYERAQGVSAAASRVVTEGHNYGAYIQFGMTNGLYVGAIVKRDDFKTTLSNDSIQSAYVTSRSHSTGAEGEIGFRTGGEDKINFDLGAGFAYVRSDIDTFNFGNIAFDGNGLESMRGRVHARVSFAGDIAPFIEARGFHEFRGDTRFGLLSGTNASTLTDAGKGTWARVEGGIAGGKKGGPLLSVWADLGDVRGFGLRGGFRF